MVEYSCGSPGLCTALCLHNMSKHSVLAFGVVQEEHKPLITSQSQKQPNYSVQGSAFSSRGGSAALVNETQGVVVGVLCCANIKHGHKCVPRTL